MEVHQWKQMPPSGIDVDKGDVQMCVYVCVGGGGVAHGNLCTKTVLNRNYFKNNKNVMETCYFISII